MKIYIVHKSKIYASTEEVYAWAQAYRTRDDAARAISAEIESDIDADMAGTEDCSDAERAEVMQCCKVKAWQFGAETETHDAILQYGDFTAYYDITEQNI